MSKSPNPDRQLRTIAEALVAEAPEAPPFPVAIDTEPSALHEEADTHRRAVGWLAPLSIAASIAASITLLAGLVWFAGRSGDPVAEPTTEVVAQPENAEESPFLLIPLPDALPEIATASDAEVAAALAPTPATPGVHRIAIARTDGGVAVGTDGRRELFVYDVPHGDPRRVSALHDDRLLHPLVHGGGPLALPVIAGDEDDPWLQVLVNTRSGARTAWVPASDYDLATTERVVVVDLSTPDDGRIRVVEANGDVVLDAPLAHSPGAAATPFAAQGFVLDGSVIDDNLPDTVGGLVGDIELALARIDLSSLASADVFALRATGSSPGPTIGLVEPDVLVELSSLLVPGTRVFVQYDDLLEPPRQIAPVASVAATTELEGPQPAPTPGREPLWQSCTRAPVETTFCRSQRAPMVLDFPAIGGQYLIAHADAGVAVRVDAADPATTALGALGLQPVTVDQRVVPVYDEPGGEPRLLVDTNVIEGVTLSYPLVNPTIWEQPLVVRIVRGLPGDEWYEIQAPTRPKRRSVYVRAADFDRGFTTASIEIDARVGGGLTLFERGEPTVRSSVVSARTERPHTFHDTLIDQVLDVRQLQLGPVYGNWLATHNTWSEAMGTFGGGGMPGQTLHGTNQPDLVDQAITSGGVRVSNEIMQSLADTPGGLLGARIVIHDSTNPTVHGIEALRSEPWLPAETTEFDPANVPGLPIPAYS